MDLPVLADSRIVYDLPHTLSADQRAALEQFQRFFPGSSTTPSAVPQSAPSHRTPQGLDVALALPVIHPAVLATRYRPLPARPFTPSEVSQGLNTVTRQSKAYAVVSHPCGSVVEYPQTGDAPKQSIAHLFAVDPANFSNPRLDFQYSFDKKHGFHSGKTRSLLKDSDGRLVSCSRWHGTCASIKTCSFASSQPVSPASRVSPAPVFNDAEKQLFLKTFGFYCALLKHGCTFSSEASEAPSDDSSELTSDEEEALDASDAEDLDCELDDSLYRDIRAPARHRCPGRFTMYSKSGRYFISCSLRKPGARGHLLLHGIEQYDVLYLQALVSQDHDGAATWERRAAERLRSLESQLASTTVRRLLLNQRFVQQLRDALGWQNSRHPTLTDLHPSLGNNDHAAYLIDEVRKVLFPNGTDFAAAIDFRGGYRRRQTFPLLVCMFPEQSAILRSGKRITVDTAFKRVHGWMELEFETWDDSSNRSISCGRVFLTALTADAHLLVFKKIYSIVEEDCGSGLRFAYMHGSGWDTVAADEHSGEALAFGRFAAWIAEQTLEPNSMFAGMTAYEHLAYFYMLCISHFQRNVKPFSSKVSQDVLEAMKSLSGTAAIEDLEATFALIRSGGKKAAAWLSDKLKGSRWALRALNQPLSHIPLEKWKAAPRTTNGNEQAHHNVNLDGTHLALLVGIMHGSEFDARLLNGRRAFAETGVQSRYAISVEPQRAERNLKRQLSATRHVLATADAEVAAAQEAFDLTVREISQNVQALDHAPASTAQSSHARKRLRELLPIALERQERLRKSAKRGTLLPPPLENYRFGMLADPFPVNPLWSLAYLRGLLLHRLLPMVPLLFRLCLGFLCSDSLTLLQNPLHVFILNCS
ncbi:hypothetical protein AURDEDRAFT_173406 [Auricularia subglabra TFB-10046 SS5]|uniref:Uncharacterized protein n=1 Tax=Auricularia subglabra (strain TFB-10046 / SS5) TaxID=717982 RepID=J0WUG5_AURST|nr:hypothetical protein AURDEDRAFT_173406 [Auricularia subglabra TFB-10046 SS5]